MLIMASPPMNPRTANTANGINSPNGAANETMTGAINSSVRPQSTPVKDIKSCDCFSGTISLDPTVSTAKELDTDDFRGRQKYNRRPSSMIVKSVKTLSISKKYNHHGKKIVAKYSGEILAKFHCHFGTE